MNLTFESSESKSYSDFVPYYRLHRIFGDDRDKAVDITTLFEHAITGINVKQTQKGNIAAKPESANHLTHLPKDEMTIKFELGMQDSINFRLPSSGTTATGDEDNKKLVNLALLGKTTKVVLLTGYKSIKAPYIPIIPIQKRGKVKTGFELKNINDWVLELPMLREYKLFSGVITMPDNVSADESGTYSTNWAVKLSSGLFSKKGFTVADVDYLKTPFNVVVSAGQQFSVVMEELVTGLFAAEKNSNHVKFDFTSCEKSRAKKAIKINFNPTVQTKDEFLEIVCRVFDIAYHILPNPKDSFSELWYFYKACNGLNGHHEDYNEAILNIYEKVDPDFAKRLEELPSGKFNKALDTFAIYLKHGDNLLNFNWGFHPKASTGNNASGTLVYKVMETDGQMVSYELDEKAIKSKQSELLSAGLITTESSSSLATQTREYVQKMLSESPERVIEFFRANFTGAAKPEKLETGVGNTGSTKCTGKLRYALPGLQCGTKVFLDVADHMKMFFTGIVPNVYTITEINNELTPNSNIWTQTLTFER